MKDNNFDAVAIHQAMDARRRAQGLSWQQVADQIWELSADLNRVRQDHPISAATLINIVRRRDCTCQHALFMLRWLNRSPESFLPSPGYESNLPTAGPDRRLRWNLQKLHDAVNTHRTEQQLTWQQLARQLHCSPSQLTGLKTVRFAIRMTLAMRLTQWLQRPAADFIYVAKW